METMDGIYLRRSVRKYTAHPGQASPGESPGGAERTVWPESPALALCGCSARGQATGALRYDEEVWVRITQKLEFRFPYHPEVVAETKQVISTLGDGPVVLLVFQMADAKTALMSGGDAENAILAVWDLVATVTLGYPEARPTLVARRENR